MLECMASERNRPPKRFALYVGHGFALQGDWGGTELVDGKMHFGKSMDAFNPLSERVLHKGLEHPNASCGGHSTADSFLTGSNPTAAIKSPSLDQIAA